MKKMSMNKKHIARRRILFVFALVAMIVTFAYAGKAVKAVVSGAANQIASLKTMPLSQKPSDIDGLTVSVVDTTYANGDATIRVRFVNNTDKTISVSTAFSEGVEYSEKTVAVKKGDAIERTFIYRYPDGINPLTFSVFKGDMALEYSF